MGNFCPPGYGSGSGSRSRYGPGYTKVVLSSNQFYQYLTLGCAEYYSYRTWAVSSCPSVTWYFISYSAMERLWDLRWSLIPE